MTIDEMKRRKRELGYTNQMVAEKSGVPLSTVQKIFSGATTSPRHETIQALESLLRPRSSYQPIPPDHGMVNEALPAYGSKRLYTLEDYLALPDDQRVELIEGVFYDMATPTTNHQAIGGFIHKKLLDHVLEHKGPCFPFISPVDVQLDCDDKTVIQPDVLVVCDRSKYKNGRVFGAPDLVVEVLSPSSRKKDMQIKLAKYYNAGVREYWIIDPEKKLLVQYDMEHMELPTVYNEKMELPVLIWDGACKIDLGEMYETISFLWESN